MRLATDIPLRRDGTVKALVPGGGGYEFKPDESGLVVADVESEDDAAFLIEAGCYPVTGDAVADGAPAGRRRRRAAMAEVAAEADVSDALAEAVDEAAAE